MFDRCTVDRPYPGLRPFEPYEGGIFFGREGHIDRLLEILQRERFLAVIGPSGGGKSSLARAGLLPALASGRLGTGSHWRMALLRPGGQPLLSLAHALSSRHALGPELETATALPHAGAPRLTPATPEHATPDAALIAAELRQGVMGFDAVLDQAQARRLAIHEAQWPPSTTASRKPLPTLNLLVLVDQFEEVFTYPPSTDPNEPARFVDILLHACRYGDGPRPEPNAGHIRVVVALTMRTDFLGHCVGFTDLPDTINRAQYLVPHLRPEELRRAVVQPAEMFNGSVHHEVAQLLAGRAQDADDLPLVQHVLSRMWHRASAREPHQPEVTLGDLRESGGVERALSLHANGIFERLSVEERELADGVFRTITGESKTLHTDTRRPQRLGQIARTVGLLASEWTQLVPVLSAFGAEGANFLRFPEPLGPDSVVDISHEALIRRWDRLHALVEWEAALALEYRRWRDRSQRHWHDGGELLTGGDLISADAWMTGRSAFNSNVGQLSDGGTVVQPWKPSAGWAQRYALAGDPALADAEWSALERFLAVSRRQQLTQGSTVISTFTFLAPIKPGLVPGADTVTYSRRLEILGPRLARALRARGGPALGVLSRDTVVRSLTYALVPPYIGSRGESPLPPGVLEPGVYRLSLSVVVQGSRERALRSMYRDLGHLLDVILCNVVGYTLSAHHSSDGFFRWARYHEVFAETLQTGGADALQDLIHYAQPTIEASSAAEQLDQSSEEARGEMLSRLLSALKDLFDVSILFPRNDDGDDARILAFAQRAMPEFREYLQRNSVDPRLGPHKEYVDWLLRDPPREQPPKGVPSRFDPADIQAGIHGRYEGVTHGCLLLLLVTDAIKARAWAGALPHATARRQAELGERLYWNVAFTANGLRALGLPPSRVDRFPREFIEGMESRAGLLGDVRTNHPEHWRRPRLASTPAVEVDLGSVHVVLQYRLASQSEADLQFHSALRALTDAIDKDRDGLLVLSAEPMRTYSQPGSPYITEHFGFVNGLSQPEPNFFRDTPPFKSFDNSVKPGELYLGHPSDRDPGRFPDEPDEVMDNGSFLVVRKLRQYVDRWQAVLERTAAAGDPQFHKRSRNDRVAACADIAAKLVGRRPDGEVLVDPVRVMEDNDFNYDGDSMGLRCPLAAHARSANPRVPASAAGGRKLPRILRRGMLYGPRFEDDPAAERGLFFMAYCGSLAEQFEVIQRWLVPGDASGAASFYGDPLLGVPQKGIRRVVPWLNVDLGDEPLVQLEWGIYLFSPSLTGLKAMTAKAPVDPPAPPVASCPLKNEPYAPTGKAFDERKGMLQGRRDDKDEFWRAINACGGKLQTAYGLLEGRKTEVLKVLRDAGEQHSVCGHGRRLAASVGPGFLGLDDPDHERLAVKSGIKHAIASIDEGVAFEAAHQIAAGVLDLTLKALAAAGQAPMIDLVRLSEAVVQRLYQAWWGLPDGRFMKSGFSTQTELDEAPEAYCPRDFDVVARLVFLPHPAPTQVRLGVQRGQAIQKAVRAYLQSTPEENLIGLTRFIHGVLKRPGQHKALNEVAWTVANAMLGFGPTTHQHFVQAILGWTDPTRSGGVSLWDLQALLLAEGSAAQRLAAAQKVLRAPLVTQMRREPVPGLIWREKPGAKKAARAAASNNARHEPPEPPKLVLGLHGLMNDEDAEALMFGGTLDPKDRVFGVHACPGHAMAIGVLLGLLSALLTAGTLKRTFSPTVMAIVR